MAVRRSENRRMLPPVFNPDTAHWEESGRHSSEQIGPGRRQPVKRVRPDFPGEYLSPRNVRPVQFEVG